MSHGVSQPTKYVYIIIETGYEGIENLCYLTESPMDVVEQIQRIREQAIVDQIEFNKELNKINAENDFDWKEPERLTKREKQQIRDFYCVQKWDGKEFSCACDELGVNPSKLMLR